MNQPAIVEQDNSGEYLTGLPDTLTEPTTQAIQRMEAEARAMETAVRIANGLSKTQMVPEHFQQNARDKNGQPHGEAALYNLAAAILYGAELGLSAVQSAQNIFVVRGKPAVYSRTMAAQVRRAGYVLEEVEASDQKVVWRAERDGTWSTSEWTIERAQGAGYTTNKLYQTNPQEMLRAKCIAEVCRIKFQDVLLGMAYSVEELQLMDGPPVQRVVKKSTAKGMDRLREAALEAGDAPERKSEPAAPERKDLPKPEQPGKPADPDPADPHDDDGNRLTPEMASDEDIAEIQAYYKRNKVAVKDAFADISQMLQRGKAIQSYNDLTAVEANDVLNLLAAG